MNRRQKKKKRKGKDTPYRSAGSYAGCEECRRIESCIEYGRGRCTEYKTMKDIRLEIERLSAGTR